MELRPVAHKGRRLAIFRVEGDTAAPLYFDGEPVVVELVDPDARPESGELYLLEVNGQCCLRRVEELADGRLRLVPVNRAVPPECVDAARVRLIAKAVRTEKQGWYERVLGDLGR